MLASLEPGTWTEVGVGVGTILLAGATFWLARGAREQVKVAAEHVVAIQRPLVQPIVTEWWEADSSRQGWIVLTNIGLGPAYNVTGGLYWKGGSGGSGAIKRAALGAGRVLETRVAPVGANINWGAALGFLRYTDSGGTEWRTDFRYSVLADAGHAVEVVDVGKISELGEPHYNSDGPVRR
jgi:hypothetical protein